MDKENEIMVQVNSLLKQRKELQVLSVSEKNDGIDLKITDINSKINKLIAELELSSENTSPQDMNNISFG